MINKIAIIGSGVVGQATGKGFIKKGFKTIFCDINDETLETLKQEGLTSCRPEELPKHARIDAFLFSVPTPTVDGSINLDYLKQAAKDLATNYLKHNDHDVVIVVRSTVPPGTCRDIIIPILEQNSEKKAGQDFGIAMNPEYLRELSATEDFLEPWIIVAGCLDKKTEDMLDTLYEPFDAKFYKLSLEEAEMQKYVHNLYNANKISFFNEMRTVAEALHIDADKMFKLVADSAEGSWNKKYGIKNLGPYSGSCLPKDASAFLSFVKKKLSKELKLLKAVINVNEDLKK